MPRVSLAHVLQNTYSILAVTWETTGAEDRMSHTQTSLSNTTFLMIVNISHFSVRDICNSHIETLDSERSQSWQNQFKLANQLQLEQS